MKGRIWIINYYTTPPEFVSNPRHLEFSNHLRDAEYDVTIFSAGYLRDRDLDLVPDRVKFNSVNYGEYKFIHVKVNHYKGNGVKRMFSIFQFAWLIFRHARKFEKPDIIFHNIHAPFDYPIVWCVRRLKTKYIVESWDLWPDSFVRFGLISAKNPLVKLAYRVERSMYEKSDKIIFTLEGGLDYLKEKGWINLSGGKIDPSQVYYINNGVNLSTFNTDIIDNPLNDIDLDDPHFFNVIYLGSIRLVNNLKELVDAAKLLISFQRVRILIYGDGPDRDYLEEYCIKNHITNVHFKEKWISFKNVPSVLSRSSLNILNYQKDFGKYGISSGKFFQYLAAGKPICSNIKMNYCLIEKYNLGIAKKLETAKEYADAILKLASLDEDSYKSMCDRVKSISKDFDYKILSSKLIEVIES